MKDREQIIKLAKDEGFLPAILEVLLDSRDFLFEIKELKRKQMEANTVLY